MADASARADGDEIVNKKGPKIPVQLVVRARMGKVVADCEMKECYL